MVEVTNNGGSLKCNSKNWGNSSEAEKGSYIDLKSLSYKNMWKEGSCSVLCLSYMCINTFQGQIFDES